MAMMSRVCPVTALALLLLRNETHGNDVMGMSCYRLSVAVAEGRDTRQS